MSNSPRFALLYLSEGQAQAEVPLNENYNALETLINANILDRDLSTPPGSPADGDAYFVLATGTDEWEDHDGSIAYYYDGWYFFTPVSGMMVYVVDEKQSLMYDGTRWVPLSDAGAYKTLTYGASMTINAINAVHQQVTLTGNVTVTLSNGVIDGQQLVLRFKQDGTGSRLLTITVGLGSTFANTTLSTTGNVIDVLTLEWSTGLTKWMVVGFVKGIS